MKILSLFLNILFPEKCLVCLKDGEILCQPCAFNLPRGFSPDGKTLAILDYGDKRVKKAIWLLKYRNKRGLAKTFAELIYETLAEELSELRLVKNFTRPLLVPVPVSARRLRERGYNQAELLARELAHLGGLEVNTGALLKSRHTESQVKAASKRERLKNLRGSFVIEKPDTVRGRNVILLDDVITTGATMSEAKNALKKAGAKNVLCVAVAH